MSLGVFVAFAVAAALLVVVVGYVDRELRAQRDHQSQLIDIVTRIVRSADDPRAYQPRTPLRPAPAPRRQRPASAQRHA